MTHTALLIAVTVARTVTNSLRRIPYVILTPLAAALGLPRQTLELALAAQWITGLMGLVAGIIIGRTGRRRTMLGAIAAFGILCVIGAFGAWGGIPALVIGVLLLVGVCKVLYDAAMQAYVGERIPYAQRGRAIGITELSWSASLLVFGPLAAVLMARTESEPAHNVTLLLAILAACAVLAFLLVSRFVPPEAAPSTAAQSAGVQWRVLLRNRSALALLVASGLSSLGMEVLGIGYELWFRDVFLLTTVALGTLSLVISAAEVTGEGAVISLADRLGKRRMTVAMLGFCALASLLLPQMPSLPAALAAFFVLFLSFEVAVVSLVSMATEALPTARSTMMGSLIASHAIARATGTILGGILLRGGGFGVNGTVGMGLQLAAIVLIVIFVVEHTTD